MPEPAAAAALQSDLDAATLILFSRTCPTVRQLAWQVRTSLYTIGGACDANAR